MSLKYRKYNSYEEYVEHQKKKLPFFIRWLSERGGGSRTRYKNFKIRLQPLVSIIKGKKVLCLGARTGEEVKAFRKLGFTETVGIDLNPGSGNKYVVRGDFHNLSYQDGSFDGVYSNAFDHAWDLKVVSTEVYRVLKPGGILAIDLSLFLGIDRDEHLWKNSYEAVLWDSVDDVVQEFREFDEVDRLPHPGHVCVILRSKKDIGTQ